MCCLYTKSILDFGHFVKTQVSKNQMMRWSGGRFEDSNGHNMSQHIAKTLSADAWMHGKCILFHSELRAACPVVAVTVLCYDILCIVYGSILKQCPVDIWTSTARYLNLGPDRTTSWPGPCPHP